MSPSDGNHDKPTPHALERIITLARRGRAQYSQRAAALSHWLWKHVSHESEPTRPWLARVFATRRVRQRQQMYRSAGGKQSSTALYALQRAAQLSQPGSRDKP